MAFNGEFILKKGRNATIIRDLIDFIVSCC